MDSEEKILKLIGFELTDENRSEAFNYLQKMRSYKKENLKKDSVNLKDDLLNLDLQTQEIAFQNYPAFIKTSECSRQVLKGWNDTTKSVENLIEKLPEVAGSCDDFVKSTLEIQQSSRLNSLTLKRHVDLLEILELPQLMESSIRAEHYEDALELAAYVQKLSAKFDNVPVINSIVKTIESSWQVMITQLLLDLKKCDLTLPKCLQIVGYLRRMQAFSSSELKLKFLQTRDSWFKEVLAGIPRNDVHQHLTKTIEVTRVNLFNIVTQFKALFDEDFSKETNSKLNLIFVSWLHEKIDDFLRTLESDLSQCNSSLMDISSILGQCMYFGVSFSRIGFDFRAQLVPIFLRVITKYLNVSLKKATKEFEVNMESFTLINKEVSNLKRRASEQQEEQANSPPEGLLDFYPLAVYCNALLNIFNELRVCSPVAIISPFIASLESSLEIVAKSILTFYRSEQAAHGLKEKETFSKMCSIFSYELIPYIQHCINLVFPSNIKIVQNFESVSTLNTKKVLEPIEHLLQ